MSANELAKVVIEKFTVKITDQVFLMIQQEEDLFQAYLSAVSDQNLDVVNQTIGKAVKAAYDLDNSGECQEPESVLIKSYTMHCLK